MGSVSETILSHVSCPVIVLRPTKDGVPDLDFSRVLVCLEDPELSDILLTQLINHNWSPHTHFVIMNIIDEDALPDGAIDEPSPRETAEGCGHLLVRRAGDRLEKHVPGSSVEECVIFGPPVKSLLDEAVRWHADLMVLCSHGRSAVERLFLGSVSVPMLRQAPCDVLIVRPQKENVKGSASPVQKSV